MNLLPLGLARKAWPLGYDFRPYGIENVYVTGGGIFPTAGSWNNTAAMVGYAQHLAKTLTESQGPPER